MSGARCFYFSGSWYNGFVSSFYVLFKLTVVSFPSMWNLHPQNCPSLDLNYLQSKFCLYQACTNFLPLIVVYYNNGCLCTIYSVFLPVDYLEIISSIWAAMHRLFPHAASITYDWGILRFGFLMGLGCVTFMDRKAQLYSFQPAFSMRLFLRRHVFPSVFNFRSHKESL